MNNWQSPTHNDTRPTQQRLTVRPIEAAKMLGVSERTLRTLIKAGEIPASKINRMVLIPIAGLEAFIERHAEPTCETRQQTDGGEA